MTMPIPLISQDNAASVLAAAYRKNSGSVSAMHAPCLVLVLPPTWNNRYQTLLYERAGLHQCATIGIGNTGVLKNISWPGPIVLHAHWFSSYFNNSRDEVEANSLLDDLCEDIALFRQRTGAKLLWTAHNVFPHDNRFPSVFMRLRQWIFEEFDAVHVMHEDHVSILEHAFSRSSPPSFVVPHMIYSGSYPDGVSKDVARNYYGIPLNDFVYGYFGSIQSYKNLDYFLTSFSSLCKKTDGFISVLIGGIPSDPDAVVSLKNKWGANPNVRLLMRNIPDHEIQYIHRASDAMVLPYGETLNSGAAFMAAGFDMPFIMPFCSASKSLLDLGAVCYDQSSEGALVSAMSDVLGGYKGKVVSGYKDQLRSFSVSEQFFGNLLSLFSNDA